MNATNPTVDLAEVYERMSPIVPYALMCLTFTFFSLVAVFGG